MLDEEDKEIMMGAERETDEKEALDTTLCLVGQFLMSRIFTPQKIPERIARSKIQQRRHRTLFISNERENIDKTQGEEKQGKEVSYTRGRY